MERSLHVRVLLVSATVALAAAPVSAGPGPQHALFGEATNDTNVRLRIAATAGMNAGGIAVVDAVHVVLTCVEIVHSPFAAHALSAAGPAGDGGWAWIGIADDAPAGVGTFDFMAVAREPVPPDRQWGVCAAPIPTETRSGGFTTVP